MTSYLVLSLCLLSAVVTASDNAKTITTSDLVTKGGTAMIRMYMDRDSLIKGCQIFADRGFISRRLAKEWRPPRTVSDAEFVQLRKVCVHAMRNYTASDMRDLTSFKDKASIGDFELGIELLSGIYPGTLWCGAGNIADTVKTEDGLGEKKKLDACCRTHDNCPINIGGWSQKFGLTNISPITCSDCQCDKTFMSCLKATSDSEADFLGRLFFNTVSIDCIRLNYPEKCVERVLGFCVREERDMRASRVYEFYDGLKY